MKLSLRLITLSSFVATAFLMLSCGARMDGSNLGGKSAILDATYAALTKGKCDQAIETIEGLYNSKYSDNQVRLARASAYGCKAGVNNFFDLAFKLPSEQLGTAAGEGSYLFRTLAKLFYKTDDGVLNERILSAKYSTYALMATLKPGRTALETSAVNWDTDNVGSLYASDRTDDANLYQVFISMAAMGAIEDRYSAPDTSTYKKAHKIGYSTSNATGFEGAVYANGDGCMYAASFLNMLDSLDEVKNSMSGTVKTALSVISNLKSAANVACELGCTGVYPTGCALSSGLCNPCPLTLRNFESCLGKTTDTNSCAAAGLIRFIDTDTNAGWVGP